MIHKICPYGKRYDRIRSFSHASIGYTSCSSSGNARIAGEGADPIIDNQERRHHQGVRRSPPENHSDSHYHGLLDHYRNIDTIKNVEYGSSIEEVVENMCKTVNDMDAFRDALRQLRFRLQGLLSYTSWGSEQFWISLSSLILCQPSSKLGPLYASPLPFAGVFCTEVRLRCNSLPFAFAPGRFSCSLGWLLSCSFPLLCFQVSSHVPLVRFFPKLFPFMFLLLSRCFLRAGKLFHLSGLA